MQTANAVVELRVYYEIKQIKLEESKKKSAWR